MSLPTYSIRSYRPDTIQSNNSNFRKLREGSIANIMFVADSGLTYYAGVFLASKKTEKWLYHVTVQSIYMHPGYRKGGEVFHFRDVNRLTSEASFLVLPHDHLGLINGECADGFLFSFFERYFNSNVSLRK